MEFQVSKITKTDVVTGDIREDSIRYKVHMESLKSETEEQNPMSINLVEDILDDENGECSFEIGDVWEIKRKSKQKKLGT